MITQCSFCEQEAEYYIPLGEASAFACLTCAEAKISDIHADKSRLVPLRMFNNALTTPVTDDEIEMVRKIAEEGEQPCVE